jgi:hypothetical protein
MALVLKDRVLETSNTTGTGSLTLNGAVAGFVTFSAAIGNTNTTYYTIELPTANQWEVGIGTVGAGTLARTTVLASSNGGSLVNFSDGSKNVFCDYPADKSVYLDATNTVTVPSLVATTSINVTGTAAFDGLEGTAGQVLTSQGSGITPTWTTNGSGTVTSVALTAPSVFTVSGSPITSTGTLALTYSGTPLPIANGGTNSTATATAGGAGYGTGTAHAYTAAGTAGQVLQSNGASAPTWVTSPAAGAGGANTQIQYNNSGVLAGNSTYTMVSGVMKENGYNFVSQADVGSAPNQIPLNQYLGNMAYQDKAGVNIIGGFVSTQLAPTQPTPTALTASATLTTAQIQTQIIQVTSATAVTLTMPTGTVIDGAIVPVIPLNSAIDFSIINTGSSSGAVTVAVATGVTNIGGLSVAINTSAIFRLRRTALNTYILYRLT